MMPEYSTGMTQPPNTIMRAPISSWRAYRGVRRPSNGCALTVPLLPAAGRGRRGPLPVPGRWPHHSPGGREIPPPAGPESRRPSAAEDAGHLVRDLGDGVGDGDARRGE